MCRNIKPLFNFDPPATDDEIRNASLQFVRKLSGFNKPSKTNELVINRTVEKMSLEIRNFLNALETKSPSKNREIEAKRMSKRTEKRFRARV